MFTGIIETTGNVGAFNNRGDDRRLMVEAPASFLRGVRKGDSIACNGVCLTVAAKSARRFETDVSLETLHATTAAQWRKGDALNLEKALTLNQPLGGHLVSGHVDGVGRLESSRPDGRSQRMVFSLPRPLARYVAKKGSVCIDGISLTVNEIKGLRFGLNIVPHTLRCTTLGQLRPGDRVNIEVDLIARYLERLYRK